MSNFAEVRTKALAAIVQAQKWKSKDWVSATDEVVAALNNGVDPKVTRDLAWPPDDRGYLSGVFRAQWEAFLRRVRRYFNPGPLNLSAPHLDELVSEAQDLQEREGELVRNQACYASSLAQDAIMWISIREYDRAVEYLQRAVKVEEQFGDAESYGPALEAVEKLREAAISVLQAEDL